MTLHTRLAVGVAVVAMCVAALGLVACSSGTTTASPESTTSATTIPRPAGPAADLSTELTGGAGVYMATSIPFDSGATGYTQHEYVAAGTATSYRAEGALTGDGRWTFAPDTSAPYRTRVVVRAPADPAAFSGTVVVEWLNVSAGADTDAEWATAHEELVRAGDVWVGVSAQRIGVEGGPVLVKVEGIPGSEQQGKGMKAIDPERYSTLAHPGDGYSFDIYTQVARAIRDGQGLSGLQAQRLIGAGQSQSAFALVTYVNGVQPLTKAFDGFLVHSRGAIGLALVGPGETANIAGAVAGTPTIFRTDQDVPVLDIQTETDVFSFFNTYAARQPDDDHFRLWEVAGTAHADVHIVGANATSLDCGVPINNGPMHIVAKAAFRALTTWMTTGQRPVTAPRLDVSGEPPTAARTSDGIATGGVRTPPVDVPVAALSGAPGPNPAVICLLVGSTAPFSAARLAELYPSRAAYTQQFEAAADATIAAGFALPEDRDALLAFADPSGIPG